MAGGNKHRWWNKWMEGEVDKIIVGGGKVDIVTGLG